MTRLIPALPALPALVGALALALSLGCGDKESGGDGADGSDGASDGADGAADGSDGGGDGADGGGDGADGAGDGADGTDGTEVEVCDDGVDNDGDGDGDCGDEECDYHPDCECVELAIAGSGEVGAGDTSGGADLWTADATECGSEGGLDQTVAWSAPGPGCFQVDTFGTDWDTVLRVVDACGGAEIACSDDDTDDEGDYSSQSKVVVGASGPGAAFLFVVDGYDVDDFGAFVLNANEVDPASTAVIDDLGGATGADVAVGDSTGVTDATASACASNPGATVTYQWTAPTTGVYTFDTFGTTYDTVLGLVDATGCTELACDDDGPYEIATENESELITAVEAGLTYFIVISGFDGETGTYTLNIAEGDASAGRE